MKVNYSDLISPYPFKTSICDFKSPTLNEIWQDVTYEGYLSYINLLSLTPKIYCQEINTSLSDWYNSLNDIEKEQVTMLDVYKVDNTFIAKVTDALNFFIVENVIWNEELSAFVVYTQNNKDKKDEIYPKSFIHTKIWNEVVGIILQLNGINNNEEELDTSKVKSKKALEIMAKLKKGREESKKRKKGNKDLQLDNLISAVANKHPSLNITNIWNITVYQLWDAFSRLSGNSIYDMSALSVSVWGDEKKQFNVSDWYKRIDN